MWAPLTFRAPSSAEPLVGMTLHPVANCPQKMAGIENWRAIMIVMLQGIWFTRRLANSADVSSKIKTLLVSIYGGQPY